jgi:Family of unknown function (DUF6088)
LIEGLNIYEICGTFSYMKIVRHRPQSLESNMLAHIHLSGRGSLFVPSDFLGLGSRQGVDFVLHRLVKRGVLRRLARGLYDFPKSHPQLGVLSPSVDAIAKALAGRDRLRIQPSGAYAANLLHLSEQVPAKAVFLTDGPSRRLKVGANEIVLRRTTPRAMAAAGRMSGLVIQGLRHLGQPHVTMERIAPLQKLLSEKDRKQLEQDITLAPAWMHPFLHAVAEGKKRV